MASINKLTKSKEKTHEGAPAKRTSNVEQLRRTVMCCMLWENNFYESGVSVSDRIKALVQEIPAKDVADIAREAKWDMHLRHTPLYLAMLICKTEAGRKEIAKLLSDICTRPDDMTEFLALYWQENGKSKPLANQIKKGLRTVFPKFDEYQLAKYNGGSKEVKLRDALCLARPKPVSIAVASLWKSLLENTLETPLTWEVELSAKGNKPEVWENLIISKKLPALATLRNLRNMDEAKLAKDLIKRAIEGINSEKLLPMNFISSARHNPAWEALLEEKFIQCFANKPKMKGRTVILVDVSGSMDYNVSGKSELKRIDSACGLAMIAREICEDAEIYSFSDRLVRVPYRRGFALKDAIIKSQTHNGTDLGGAVRTIQCENPDRLIVITDEQSQSPVPNAIGNMQYMINVAPYQNGVSYRNGWQHIDGWSDKVLNYINEVENVSVSND